MLRLKIVKLSLVRTQPATLTFKKVSKAFVSGGSFTTSDILLGVAGPKSGYTLKEIKALVPLGVASVTGTKPNLSLTMTKIGSFRANIVLEHSTKGDTTITGAEFKIGSSAGEPLTFDKLTKVYSSGGRFTTAEILGSVRGTKTGYTLREMRSLTPIGVANVTGTKPNLSLSHAKAGTFMATLVLEHATKGDSTIDNASFEITKASAPILTWTKQSKPYVSGGEISNAELLAGLTGSSAAKTGYTIKSVIITNTNVTGARVSGTGTGAKIVSYTKVGILTLTIVFEHPTKSDVTLTGVKFELTKGSAESLTWTKQTKAFSSGDEITNAHLLAGVTGSGKTRYTIKTVNITNTNGTGARVSGSGRAAKITSYTKAGTLTLTIVLEHDTKDDVTITGATFEIYRDIFTISSVGEVKLKASVDRNSLTTVTIPNMINGATVTSIGDEIFKECISLTSITIPNSVTSIGNAAFNSCISLTGITLPNSVTSIGDEVFKECISLISITLPNSVTSIGDEVFKECISLTSITLPNSVTSIGDSAFKDCSSLTSITLPNSVTTIGNEAFNHCTKLTSITIPNFVTSIGISAFSFCTSLTSITIGNSVTSIGNKAFENCTSLTSITLPNSVTSIGDGAFQICSSLTSITLPNSIKSIESYLFYGCSSLTSITIPNSVTQIALAAFYGCSSLTSITIPNSVTQIQQGAFYGCSSLTNITIPNSVTSIESMVFYDCSKLTTIRVPTAKVDAWSAKLKKGNTALVVRY